MSGEYITSKDAATLLGVIERRIIAMIRNGKIAATKVNRDYIMRYDDLLAMGRRGPGHPALGEEAPGRPVDLDISEAQFLNTQEAAESVGVSISTVQKLCKSGQLPAQRFGRDWVIRRADLGLIPKRGRGRPRKWPVGIARPRSALASACPSVSAHSYL